MSLKHLGERFDVHTGGIDLKFPHHEDEIAQSEGALGHPVVSVWMHGEFLTMDDAKMAKSAGNIIRVADLPDLGYEPLAFRYLALTAHYRSKLDFTEDAMHAATSGLARLRRAAAGPDEPVDLSTEPMAGYPGLASPMRSPTTWPRRGRWRSLTRSPPTPTLTDAQRRALLLDFDRVLGLSLERPAEVEAPLPEGADELLERRAAAEPRATSPRPTRCATSSPRSASRCATRPRARRPPSGVRDRGSRYGGSGARRSATGSGRRQPRIGPRQCRLTLGLDRDRDPAVADGEDDGVGPIRRRELVRDRPQVVANGLLADPEDLADQAIRPSTSDMAQHFELARGQRASLMHPSHGARRHPRPDDRGRRQVKGPNSRLASGDGQPAQSTPSRSHDGSQFSPTSSTPQL